MSITSDLQRVSARTTSGGAKIYIVEYDSTKEPYNDHASLDTALAASGTTLSTYGAVAAAAYCTNPFGSSGALDIDLFNASVREANKAFSALSSGNFTITAATNDHAVGAIVKLYDADDYALGDWKDIGHTQGSTHDDNQENTPVYDDQSAKVHTQSGNRDIKVVTTMMQVGKPEYDFLFKEARSKYFAMKLVKEMGTLGYLVTVFRKVQLITKASIAYQANNPATIPVSFEVLTVDPYYPYETYMG